MFQINTIQRSAVNAAAVFLLSDLEECTAVGAGIGAVCGAVSTGGNPVGVVGAVGNEADESGSMGRWVVRSLGRWAIPS